MRGRLYMPNQRYGLHHKICNLRYGTHGYGMSAYRIIPKLKVFNSLQFIIGIIGRIVSGLFTTYIVRLVDKLTQK